MPPKFLPCLPPAFLLGALLVNCSCPQPPSTSPNSPPISQKRLDRYGFVDVRTAIPDVIVDLRYATTDNVTGKRIYPPDMPCLLRKSTARKLALAQQYLRAEGYGLKIWDAYRPTLSHLALWEAAPSSDYVTPPSVSWSNHCAGVAVDLTLVDAQGREMRMPTKFDQFTPEASSTYRGSDPEVRRNLERLQQAMRRAGFVTISKEWWHFDEASPGPTAAISASSLGIELPIHVRNLKPS